MVKQPANVFNKRIIEAKPKTEKFKTSLSRAPIIEAKQLYLQILKDRSFLVEIPEIFKQCVLTEGRLV